MVLNAKTLDDERDYVVAITETQQIKHHFHVGDKIQGTAWTKKHPQWEYADYYRAGALKKLDVSAEVIHTSAPWTYDIPPLETYAWRGCRMLDKRRWSSKCFACIYAAMANVTIEYDWGVSQKFRFESFCYGPKNCEFYLMGKPRPVPYKDCGNYNDEGWLDEICTENRNEDD